MEYNFLRMWGIDWADHKLHLYADKEALLITYTVWMSWKGDLVIRNNSLKVLGKTGEGRLDYQTKHSSTELVDDGAASVLDIFMDQGLVRGSMGLELVKEGLGLHGVRCVGCGRCGGRSLVGWLGWREDRRSSPLSDAGQAGGRRTRERNEVGHYWASTCYFTV